MYPARLDYTIEEMPCKKKGFRKFKKTVIALFEDCTNYAIELEDTYEADMLYFFQDIIKGLEKAEIGGTTPCAKTNAGWRMTREQWEDRCTFKF